VYVHDVCKYILIDHHEQDHLLETHEIILRLHPFDYSQATLSYGARMEAAATSKMEFDQTLESMRARMYQQHSVISDLKLHRQH